MPHTSSAARGSRPIGVLADPVARRGWAGRHAGATIGAAGSRWPIKEGGWRMPETVRAQTIAEALATWNREEAREQAAEAERLRAEFVERFPIDRWADLSLESYALGREVEGGSFCWWLEFKTRPVGSISG